MGELAVGEVGQHHLDAVEPAVAELAGGKEADTTWMRWSRPCPSWPRGRRRRTWLWGSWPWRSWPWGSCLWGSWQSGRCTDPPGCGGAGPGGAGRGGGGQHNLDAVDLAVLQLAAGKEEEKLAVVELAVEELTAGGAGRGGADCGGGTPTPPGCGGAGWCYLLWVKHQLKLNIDYSMLHYCFYVNNYASIA